MRFVTDFADQAVLVPVAACVALLFASSGWRRGALVWGAVVCSTSAALAVAKLAILIAGSPLPGILCSPSGHVEAATLVYGLLAVVSARRWPRHAISILAVTAAGMALVGTSRVALGAHTVADVLVGAALGALGLLLFAVAAGSPTARPVSMRGALLILALVATLHGSHLPTEAALGVVARTLLALHKHDAQLTLANPNAFHGWRPAFVEMGDSASEWTMATIRAKSSHRDL